MKHIVLIISLVVIPILAIAQTQIPNSSFENWTIAANGTDSLIGWSSSNLVVINPVISLYSDIDSYQGSLAANLVTAPFGFVQYSTIGILVNGQATFSYGGGSGSGNVKYISGGGTPISYKPTKLNGYYKTTTLSQGDLPFVKVLLTKYNTTLNKRDTVSYSESNFTTSNNNYSPFSIPLVDLLPGVTPDTITTIFYSSNPAFVNTIGVWSNLYIDNIYLSSANTTGIELNTPTKSDIQISPNPFQEQTIISVNQGNYNQLQLEVYDALGRSIPITYTEDTKRVVLSRGNLGAGVYWFRLIGDGQVIGSGKLIIED